MDKLVHAIGVVLGRDYVDKCIDDEFLSAVFEEVVSELEIHDYVENGLSLNEEAPMLFAAAAYSEKEKNVKIFNTARRDADYEVAVRIGNVPESKKIFAANLLIVTALLHELEHAKQRKMIDYDDSLEADLLRLCHDRKENMSTYDLIPAERFAESKALGYAINMLDGSGLIIPELEKYLVEQRYYKLYAGYEEQYASGEYIDKCRDPISAYKTKHNIEQTSMSISESVQIEPDLEKRLYYGMPITMEERKVIRKRAGLNPIDSKQY